MAEDRYIIDGYTARVLHEMRERVTGGRGRGVRNSPHGQTVNPPTPLRQDSPDDPIEFVQVQRGVAGGGGGKYLGVIVRGLAGPTNMAWDQQHLALPEEGMWLPVGVDYDCVLIYPPERGQTTQILVSNPTNPKPFVCAVRCGADVVENLPLLWVVSQHESLGQYQYMVRQMVAQNAAGWDFVRTRKPL